MAAAAALPMILFNNKWTSSSRLRTSIISSSSSNDKNDNSVHDDYDDYSDDGPLMFKEEFEVGSQVVSFKTHHRMKLKCYRDYIYPKRCLKWKNRQAVVMDMEGSGGGGTSNNKLLTVLKVWDEDLKLRKGDFWSFPPVTNTYEEDPFLDAAHPPTPPTEDQKGGFPIRRIPIHSIIRRSINQLFPFHCYRRNFAKAAQGVVKSDGKQDPVIMAINAMSAALMLSDVAWNGPIGVVRIGRIKGSVDGGFVVNPGMDQILDLNLLYACTRDRTLMIDLEACEISDRDVEAALRLAHHEAVKYLDPQIRLAAKAGKLHNKKDYRTYRIPDHIRKVVENKVKSLAEPQIEAAIFNTSTSNNCHHLDNIYGLYVDQLKREQVLDEIARGVEAAILGKECTSSGSVEEEEEADKEIRIQKVVPKAVCTLMKNAVRSRIIEKGIRVDGRRDEELRTLLYCESGTLPVYYGSSVFGRGDVSVLFHVLLANSKIRNPDSSPCYQRRICIDGRVGKPFYAVLPLQDDFPYQVRVQVDVMVDPVLPTYTQSFGNWKTPMESIFGYNFDLFSLTSYMESVCGVSLALMDAGIPLKRHVAGVSMGLVSEVDPCSGIIMNYRILTDIDHPEYKLGDMHLKIAGTRKGVTSIQMEYPRIASGIPLDIICECLKPASKALHQILDHMEREIDAPRRINYNSMSPKHLYNMDFLGRLQLIGPTAAAEYHQASQFAMKDQTVLTMSGKAAKEKVVHYLFIRNDYKVERIYEGVVISIREEDGAFVEIDWSGCSRLGFLPVNEMQYDDDDDDAKKNSQCRVYLGQQLSVICIGYDSRGFLKLSSCKTASVHAPNEEDKGT